MTSPANELVPADICWQGQTPVSKKFDDIYFSTRGGLEETNHVFLENGQIARNWASQRPFTITELGFGTGLNFLATWLLWQNLQPDRQPLLHFFSCEKYPLSPADLAKAHSFFPEIRFFSDPLLAALPPRVPGFHRLLFAEGRVVLTLFYGEAADFVTALSGKSQAFFLDGFSPAKNAEMWSEQIFAQLARLAENGSTVATFTAAGKVRRGLSAAGFDMNKVAGFGGKREMLRGVFSRAATPAPSQQPWFDLPVADSSKKTALVIGAGLAGSAMAAALARRNFKVTVLEKNPTIAGEASGNPAGSFFPLLSASPTVMSELTLSSYGFLLSYLKFVSEPAVRFEQCGVLQLAADEDEEKRLKAALARLPEQEIARWLTNHETKERGCPSLAAGGVLFSEAGWLNPPSFCQAQISSRPDSIELLTSQQVTKLEHSETGWLALGPAGEPIASAQIAVLACSGAALDFEQTSWLPLDQIRGQIDSLPASSDSLRQKMVLSYDGYLLPAIDGKHIIGASFVRNDSSTEIRLAETRQNLQLFTNICPEHSFSAEKTEDSRVSFRSATTDRVPVAGPVPDRAAFENIYAGLKKGYRGQYFPAGPYLPSLYCSLAHGSRGILTALMAAELVAAQINGEMLPLAKPIVDALNPARFLIRNLRRGRRQKF